MKKTTLLVAFFATIFYTNAQKTYDFTSSANPGSWVHKGGATSATASADGMVLEFSDKTPRLDITRAADPFSVSAGTHAVLTIINNSTEVGSYRMQYDKNSSGQSGIQYLGWTGVLTPATTPGNGTEQTVVFPLTSSHFNNDGGGTGTVFTNDTDGLDNMEYIAVAFRNAAGENLTGDSATNGNIIIKKIEIVNAGALTNNNFDFSSDNAAGFEALNSGDATITTDGTSLNFTNDNTKTAPKIAQTFYGADASSSTYAHFVISGNASNADQVKFQFVDANSTVQTYGPQTLNNGTATTISVALSGKPEWTGVIKDWRLVFSNTEGANVNTGTISISEIVFNTNETLSTTTFKDFAFSIYPNPTNSVVNIFSENKITKLQLFNIVGKKVLETKNLQNNTINVSHLNAGVYLLRLQDDNNKTKTQKLIIN